MKRSPPTSTSRMRAACAVLALGLLVPASRLAADDRAPVDVFFVLDNSGSMRSNDPDRAMRTLVVDFAARMSPDSRLGIVAFDGSARLIEPLSAAVGPGTAMRWGEVMSEVDYAGQWSNSPAGVERALYELRRSGREGIAQAIVFVTDGLVDTGDRARDLDKARWLRDELAAEASRAHVRIYGIALAEQADVEIIQALAHRTGGEYWRVARASDVAAALNAVGRTMSSRATNEPPQVVSPTPPTPSAPAATVAADPTRGVVLLALGFAVAAVVLVAPLVRRRWRLRVRPPVASALSSNVGSPLIPALPRGGRPPIVELVDVSDATGRGKPILLLDAATTRLGRDPNNQVVIPSDTVSSFHATIDHRDGYFHVEDHRSTNGTWLSGRRLFPNRPARLKSGDVIDLAGHEFRFLIPDHEPRGRTLVLDGTSRPGPSMRSVGKSVADAESDAVPDAVPRLITGFDQCLGDHLSRVAALGEAHRRFVERAFPIELRARLVGRAQDVIEACQRRQQGMQSDFARDGIHYSICALPLPIDQARGWYVDHHGGFAKFLVGRLDAWARPDSDCVAICVITFGTRPGAWISVTIVPARSEADAIEVMSLEFLTDDERHEAASLEIVDVDARG